MRGGEVGTVPGHSLAGHSGTDLVQVKLGIEQQLLTQILL